MWYDVIIGQNCFTNNKDIVTQYDGFAMGAPSSGLIAETFLQNTEHLHLAHLTHRHRIINYWRYVDDILLIFDSNHTNIQAILDDFNALHPKLHFTAEAERDHTKSYLHISIHRTPTSIRTFTDTVIPYTSNQPTHHKYATVKFPFNRLNSYNLQQEEYRQELNIIHNILHNNSFPIIPQNPLYTPQGTNKSNRHLGKVGHFHLCR
jgi:hypothetical protein